MLRSILTGAVRSIRYATPPVPALMHTQRAYFGHFMNSLQMQPKHTILPAITLTNQRPNLLQLPIVDAATSRSVTKFSLIKGKRKSVKAVLKRFKRLDWGAWIRTHSGRHKKMFKKSNALKRRLRQHVFTNATQSWLLDKMVTSFWRRPKHYIDDPYTPYHKRDEYFATKSKTFKV